MAPDPGEQIALFRYRVIAEALDKQLTPAEKGELVRELSSHTHELPDGSRHQYSRATIDRWIADYQRAGGLDGLRPQQRSDVGLVRKQPELLEEACALRLESPRRSAAQISRILLARHHVRVPERTITSHFQRLGLTRHGDAQPPSVFGRFQADLPNEMWIGDVLHGPQVLNENHHRHKAFLFMFIDDHSRFVVHGRFCERENTRAGQQVLREAILAYGQPGAIYLDNGSPFRNGAIERTCAVLGIRLLHSRPGRPQGRGKVERTFRFVREAFLSEIEGKESIGLAELNDLFTAWVDRVCNRRVHAETKERPCDRFNALQDRVRPSAELIYQAFRWSTDRKVSKTGLVSLEGNRYSVDPSLVGRRVDLVYDPDDLSRIDVWFQGKQFGTAVPFVVGRHVVPPTTPLPEAPPQVPGPTGPDYLETLRDRHLHDTIGGLSYRDLPADGAIENTDDLDEEGVKEN